MSLLSKPLDYSSQTTKTTIEGIRGQMQLQERMRQEAQAERKRQDNITSRIEGQFSTLQGKIGGLDAESKRIFQEGYMQGYTTELNKYSLDPSQENLNRLMTVVSDAQNFLSVAPAAYSSDNNTLVRGMMDNEKYEESPDEMQSRYNQKWGRVDDVRYNPETLQVEMVDSRNGQTEYGSVYGGRYKADQETALVFTPKSRFNYTDPISYGYKKAQPLIVSNKVDQFGSFFDAEYNSDANLKNSVIMTYAEVMNTTPQAILSSEGMEQDAKEYYLENAKNEILGIKQSQMQEEAEKTNPYSGTTSKLVGENKYEIDLLKNPVAVYVERDPGSEETPVDIYRIRGYRVVGNELVVDYAQEMVNFVDMSGNELQGDKLKEAMLDYSTNKANLGTTYNFRKDLISKTEVVDDPKLFESFYNEITRQGLPFNK